MPVLPGKWAVLLFIAVFATPLCIGSPLRGTDDDYTSYPDKGVYVPLSKKWFAVKGDAQKGGLWPNKEVKYIFADDRARITLEGPLQTAMHQWYCAGLPEDFKLTRVSGDSVPGDRSKYLIISLGGGSLKTTNGCPSSGKPTSILSINQNVGTGNVQANIAHEIGHMFGLVHEHQNPAFWGHSGDAVFKINCENLADYATVEKKQGKGAMDGLCREYSAATEASFSAYDFLPIHKDTRGKDVFMKSSDVDWDSIMMYSSQVGGKGSGPTRAEVLMRVDGQTTRSIPPNLQPSTQDVEGLIEIYRGA